MSTSLPKSKDWSYNLEFEDDERYIIDETLKAIAETGEGHYVNIVTNEQMGHPDEWLISRVKMRLEENNRSIKSIHFIAHCGCGGFVTRIYV